MGISRRIGMMTLCMVILFTAVGGCGIFSTITGGGRTQRLFGATYMTMNNPYFEVLNDSLSDVIEANGDILIVRDPSRDQEKQNAQIMEMIDEGISVLFLNPVDWKAVRPALEMCRDAGVAVIGVDTLVYDTDLVVTTIESDNYGGGVLCAQDMMKKRESARIVVLGSSITASILNRVQGFLDTIAPYGQYQVVAAEECFGELEISLGVMTRILDTDVDIDVVLGGNDPTALGALAALQQRQRDVGVMIYGVDGSPDFKSVLKAGLVTGTGVQSPKTIGTMSAETAYQYLNGEEVPEYISIPVTMLTRENLTDADLLGWQ